MESVENTRQPARRMASTRSRVTNGSKLLPLTDGRSATARRFKDLIEDISADLGGPEMVSTAQHQLIRRASLLSAELERLEALWARDERLELAEGEIKWKSEQDSKFDTDRYVVLRNALRRVLETVGLERRMRDATPTLSTYLAAVKRDEAVE
jgi:hypothetical protein